LFLVPKPTRIEGEQRFELGMNTRTLVEELERGSDLYRTIDAAYRAVTQGLPKGGRSAVGNIIRQVVLVAKSGRVDEAEKLVQNALEKFPSHPDLTGMLGWVYKNSRPARLTDARECFQRAHQLKCRNRETYRQWALMEMDEREWTRAAEAAEKGAKLTNDRRLLHMAGSARSRLGQDLIKNLITEKGQKELSRAREILEGALKDPSALAPGERNLNAEIYRSLAITAEWQGDVEGVKEFLECWRSEHPDDPMQKVEADRLRTKFRF
jgi:tetratricopeptide (TPR) repeat protein